MKNNLELWSKVETTDKKFTKKQSFGAKLTAIDQMYQFKNATELFGPFGIGWGVKEETYQKVDSFIIYTATLWYKYNGDEGAFPISSDQKLKDDCIKSVQTDAITKGLSRLGFNADIFLGTFDGNKYVGGKADAPRSNRILSPNKSKNEESSVSYDGKSEPPCFKLTIMSGRNKGAIYKDKYKNTNDVSEDLKWWKNNNPTAEHTENLRHMLKYFSYKESIGVV